MQRLIVLRGPTSSLRARPELTPGPEDLVVTPSGEVPWEGVRRLLAALAARPGGDAIAALLATERAAASLVLRGLAPDLDPAEQARRAVLAAQAPGFLSHNGYVVYGLRAAFVRVLAPLLAGRRVLVPRAEALDLHSAVVLIRVAAATDVTLVFGCDPARLPADPLWRREGLRTLSTLQHAAAADHGVSIDLDDEDGGEAFETCPFVPSPWDDALEPRALAALAGEELDVSALAAAIEAAWACYGFDACLRLGLDLLRRVPTLDPALRRRVALLVALSAYNRQVGTRGESLAADEALAQLIDAHLVVALAGEDDPSARSHLLYRLAINRGRRRGDLPAARELADAAVAEALRAGAPFFAAWARNGRAYVLGRMGELDAAIADVLIADEEAAAPVEGPLAGEQPMTRAVLADNLAALYTWARRPHDALRWQAVHRERSDRLAIPSVPSTRWLELYTALGDLAAAARVAEEGLAIAESLMAPLEADVCAAWLGEIRYRQGDAAAARRAFARACALTGRMHADDRELPTRIAAALAAMRSGELATAEAEFAAILAERPAPELLAQAGVVAALAGDAELAAARVNEAIAAAVDGGERDELLRVAVAAGEACLALGDQDGARSAFAQALELAGGDSPAQPTDLLIAVACAAELGIIDTGLIDHVFENIDAALADAECWWHLARLARGWLASDSRTDPAILRARLAQRVDADPTLLAALLAR